VGSARNGTLRRPLDDGRVSSWDFSLRHADHVRLAPSGQACIRQRIAQQLHADRRGTRPKTDPDTAPPARAVWLAFAFSSLLHARISLGAGVFSVVPQPPGRPPGGKPR